MQNQFDIPIVQSMVPAIQGEQVSRAVLSQSVAIRSFPIPNHLPDNHNRLLRFELVNL